MGSDLRHAEPTSFMMFHLSIVDLSACAISVLFRKLSPVPMPSRLFPTSPSIWFSVSGFMVRPLIHLGLHFLQDNRYGSVWIILHTCIQSDLNHLLKMLASFSKIRCLQLGGFVWVFCSIPLINACYYANTMLCFLCSCVVQLENAVLLFRIALAIVSFCVSLRSWKLSFQGL